VRSLLRTCGVGIRVMHPVARIGATTTIFVLMIIVEMPGHAISLTTLTVVTTETHVPRTIFVPKAPVTELPRPVTIITNVPTICVSRMVVLTYPPSATILTNVPWTFVTKKKGCYTEDIVCDDSDPCTINSCDHLFGCVFVRVNCDDDNVCTTDSCHDGMCVHTAITCDDDDKCTDDSCDPVNGCEHKDACGYME